MRTAKSFPSIVFLAAAAAVVWSGRGGAREDATATSAVAALAGGCSVSFTSPLLVPMPATTIGGILIDDACDYVYLTNKTLNRVEVYSLQTLSFETPIQVGSQPMGLDITPDGSLMYVANTGGTNISVVDLAQRLELRKINVPPGFSNDKPYSIAIANNGLAMFSTTFAGSGFGGRLLQLVLATDATSVRTDFHISGSTTEQTQVRASDDRSVIAAMAGDISSGPVFKYTATANTWGPAHNLQTFISGVSLDMTGSNFLVQGFSGTYVLDSALNLSGTVLTSGWGGTAVDPTFGIGYKSVASRVDILNMSTFLKTGELPLGDSVSSASLSGIIGQMDLSGDGTLLAVITNTGFSLVRPFATPLEDVNLVRNGSFGNGLARWLTFATPDMSYIVSNIVGGVFEFHRVAPPPGTSNQAVVYQETGMSLPSGAPIHAQFSLGNSSTLRKRISVLLLDGDFSDLHVCTFWLPPALPLTAFEMKTHTTKAWSNASIYFYAATPGSDGGAYRLDNVSLRYDTNLPADRTECVNPLAPIAPGGLDGPDLVTNGDFGTGDVSPWLLFGTITSQVALGVFEFIRPNATPPAGVIFQPSNQALANNAILTATFQMGNSSPVRKRVTVILHDNDFSDLAACTFWLAPGQALSPYVMRTFATQAWANATISVYAATVGADQWIQLDNVTFRRTPTVSIGGTECEEPIAPIAGLTARAPRLLTRPSERPRATAGTRVLELSDPIDLTAASSAGLTLQSWLPLAGSRGEIQISTDGVNWKTLLSFGPSEDWQLVAADLSDWLGERIAIRFVLYPGGLAERKTPTFWRLSDVRVDISR